MSDLVAKIPAHLSIKRGEGVVLDSEEGYVLLRRDEFEFATEEFERIIPLSACTDIKVATVPEEYERLFDETIALRFSGKNNEWEVVCNTDTETTEQFVTVLLKLLLDETTVLVSELDQSEGTQSKDRGTLTLSPGSETVHLGTDDPLTSVETERLLSVEPTSLADGSIKAVEATHLTDATLVRTEVAFQSERRRRFLRRYLDFRQERSQSAGPLSILVLDPEGNHGDPIRQSLGERRAEYAVATTTDPDTALEALDEAPLDCLVAAYNPVEMDCVGFLDDVRERSADLPLVFFSTDEDLEMTELAPGQDATTLLTVTDFDSPLGRFTDEIERRARDYRRGRIDADDEPDAESDDPDEESDDPDETASEDAPTDDGVDG